MKKFKKVYGWAFSVLLAAFTLYALLDTFVITRVYAAVPAETAVTLSEDTGSVGSGGSADLQAGTEDAVVTENSYADGHLQIMIETYRVEDTTVYVADVLTDSPEYLKTALSNGSYGRNVTAVTSETAEASGAILAVNGDNYGSRESGYVLRNGVLYRDAAAGDQEDLVIYEDGSFEVISESEVTAQALLAAGARQVFSFGPGLIEDGEVMVGQDDEVDRARASNPRTAVGIIGEGHYVLVVSDGRTSESEGLSLYELACFLKELGVETAYNLDGGGSSTMVFMGEVVNQPTSGHAIRERAVTDIVYIGY